MKRVLRTNMERSHHRSMHPAYRRDSLSLSQRIADGITKFAGNIRFVGWHILWFAVWMLFIESEPWPTLTLIVSLEAIFLATFVLIGQNRMSEIDRAQASHDYVVNRETRALLMALHSDVHGAESTQSILDDTD